LKNNKGTQKHQNNYNYPERDIYAEIAKRVTRLFAVTVDKATKEQIYKAVALSVRDILAAEEQRFEEKNSSRGKKKVNYLCMEFLVGPSLKNNLFNLGLTEKYRTALGEMGFSLDEIFELEKDPGLGNGGLGRLAACFMDSFATLGFPARGYSICYEYGLFRQRIVDGEQLELPDAWLQNGESWLIPREDKAVKVRLGGRVEEVWQNNHLDIVHTEYEEVEAVPCDMLISGYASKGVAPLRLWKARALTDFNMEAFSQGQYLKAVEESAIAETLTRVLYPADNHHEGKLLRLSQQYFLVSASLQNIVAHHVSRYRNLDTLPDKTAIHINDTHPALAVPELMRILLDIHNYPWEKAWDITVKTISYTNHTVLPEAMECWNENLFRIKLPRIYMIIKEINRRFCNEAWEAFPGLWDKISRMAPLSYGLVKMANLSVIGSHSVNGVSKLHSDILKAGVVKDFDDMYPGKLTNVTNGIAHRRWLCMSNPRLTSLIAECIGDGFIKNPALLEDFSAFAEDSSVLSRIGEIKRQNKADFADYIAKKTGNIIDPDSIFDVHVKRLHEYKRQLMNALNIASLYARLKEDPNLVFPPQTFIFGAKAAPGYYFAKDIIRFICFLAKDIDNNPVARGKLKVVFLENYSVSLAERLIPAAELSEQISLAGKEASGTGNMKFMINGALTIGTLDGANVEIASAVGEDNMFIFGHTASEVDELWKKGYSSASYYNRNENLKSAIDSLQKGFNSRSFSDIANYLLYSYGVSDPYMCLADFAFYSDAREAALKKYADKMAWNASALINISKAGGFAADRSVGEYAKNIWGLESGQP